MYKAIKISAVMKGCQHRARLHETCDTGRLALCSVCITASEAAPLQPVEKLITDAADAQWRRGDRAAQT